MKTYDVRCPICGALNNHLYLEETDGWMECKYCRQTVQILISEYQKRIPVYRGSQLAEKFVSARNES